MVCVKQLSTVYRGGVVVSRIGKTPIEVPKGVTVTLTDRRCVVKGPKGQLEHEVPENFKVNIEDGIITIERPNDARRNRALHGLTRNLINNMVVGVSQGFEKRLEIVGVGYKVAVRGNGIQLNVGYSHPLVFDPGPGIEFEVPNQTAIVIKGIDKQKVGQMAADIRGVRPPEPYKGKGIKYSDERIRRKVGKSGA
jgi:large subunit ribosomal protein L6